MGIISSWQDLDQIVASSVVMATLGSLVPVVFGSTADTIQYLRANGLLAGACTCSK